MSLKFGNQEFRELEEQVDYLSTLQKNGAGFNVYPKVYASTSAINTPEAGVIYLVGTSVPYTAYLYQEDDTFVSLGTFQGLKGDAGAVGATGAKGDKGDTGARGPQGKQGIKGDYGGSTAFSDITGDPYDNTALASDLNAKQDTLTAGSNISLDNNIVATASEVEFDKVATPSIEGDTVAVTATNDIQLNPINGLLYYGDKTAANEVVVTNQLTSLETELKEELAGKQDKINAYLKSASQNGNTLTLTNKDDAQLVYTPDLSSKQDVLTAGSNITITKVEGNTVISASGELATASFAQLTGSPNDNAALKLVLDNKVDLSSEQTLTGKKIWSNGTYTTYIQPNAISTTNGTSTTSIVSSGVQVGSTKYHAEDVEVNGQTIQLPTNLTSSNEFAMKVDGTFTGTTNAENIVVSGDLTCDGDTTIANGTVSGELDVPTPTSDNMVANKGYVDNKALFSNIVDSEGNNRFVEGNITTSSALSSITSYAKWSLSGTHLMLVVSITPTEDLTLNEWTNICYTTVPTFISNKVIPPFSSQPNISIAEFYGYSATLSQSTDAIKCYLVKDNSRLIINNRYYITLTANYNYRIQFDLIID